MEDWVRAEKRFVQLEQQLREYDLSSFCDRGSAERAISDTSRCTMPSPCRAGSLPLNVRIHKPYNCRMWRFKAANKTLAMALNGRRFKAWRPPQIVSPARYLDISMPK